MTQHAYRQEILRTLDQFHAAQKAGDVEALVDALTLRFESNGVPHGRAPFRKLFEALVKRDAYRDVKVDMGQCRVSVDESSERAKLFGVNAVVEPVIYDSPAGRNVLSYALIRKEDGRWRFLNQLVIPHPEEPAITAPMLADAGRPLDNLTMVWTRKLDVPLAEVWAAVSTPEGLRKWWLGGPRYEHRNPTIEIDLRVGGIFRHNWFSEILALRERAFIDFKEFRFELRPDGDGTLFSLVVFTLDGEEWRAFYRCVSTRLYCEQFGGLDPWSARSWHGVVDQLEHVLTGRTFEHTGESPVYSYALTRFYLAYLRELATQRRLSSERPPLLESNPDMDDAFPRSDRRVDPEVRKARMYERLRLRTIVQEPQWILAIQAEVPRPPDDDRPYEVERMVRERMPAVAAQLAAQGIEAVGRPVVRMLERAREAFRFEFGYPVSADAVGHGDLQRRLLPGGTVVVADLEGSQVFPGFHLPWVIRYAEEQGFALDPGWGGNGVWQVFLNDAALTRDHGGRYQLCLAAARADGAQ